MKIKPDNMRPKRIKSVVIIEKSGHFRNGGNTIYFY